MATARATGLRSGPASEGNRSAADLRVAAMKDRRGRGETGRRVTANPVIVRPADGLLTAVPPEDAPETSLSEKTVGGSGAADPADRVFDSLREDRVRGADLVQEQTPGSFERAREPLTLRFLTT